MNRRVIDVRKHRTADTMVIDSCADSDTASLGEAA